MKFYGFVLKLHLPQNIYHARAQRHFPEIVQLCAEYPKTYKSVKNRKSKLFGKPILFSIYVEESKKICCFKTGYKSTLLIHLCFNKIGHYTLNLFAQKNGVC